MNHIESKENSDFQSLVNILLTTNSHAVRDEVSIKLVDLKNPVAIDFIVQVLSKPETYNHRSTLVYSCWELGDCSKYLEFFVDLALHDVYGTSDEAYTAIVNMQGPFDEVQLLNAYNKVKNSLNNIDTDHKGIARGVLKILDKFLHH